MNFWIKNYYVYGLERAVKASGNPMRTVIDDSECTEKDFARGDHRHPSDNSKEDVANKITTLTGTATNSQYPSAKLFKDTADALGNRIDVLENRSSVIYISNSTPTSSFGNDGDIYIQN